MKEVLLKGLALATKRSQAVSVKIMEKSLSKMLHEHTMLVLRESKIKDLRKYSNLILLTVCSTCDARCFVYKLY